VKLPKGEQTTENNDAKMLKRRDVPNEKVKDLVTPNDSAFQVGQGIAAR
jgi:hypothetical protein